MGNYPIQPSEPSLLGIDFVFDMGMKKIEEQIKEIDALDLKISVLFGFLGTVLVALLAVVFTADWQSGKPSSELAAWVLLNLGVALTGIAIFNAFQAFRVRQSYGSPRFSDLFRWANEDPKLTKYRFLNTLLTAVDANTQQIERKLSYANRATWCVFLGFLSFLFAIIVIGAKLLFPACGRQCVHSLNLKPIRWRSHFSESRAARLNHLH